MILILMIIVGAGSFALGVGLTLVGKIATNIGGKDRKALSLARKNLNIAEAALRKVANPATGRPDLEADLALTQIDSNTEKFLEGR